MKRLMGRVSTRECIVVLCLVCIVSGCEVREQDRVGVVEANAIAHIQRDLKSYENNHPGVPITNILQLLLNTTNSPWGYPYKIEAQMRSLKQGPGFTNTIYEKYVVMPQGISNQPLTGELVLMNAQPFTDENGDSKRIVICKRGPDYVSGSYAESVIQQIVSEAGIEIPKPTVLSKPPAPLPESEKFFGEKDVAAPSLATRAKDRLNQFGKDLGIGDGHWMTLAFSLGFIILLGVVACGLFIRRSRQQPSA